MSQVLYDVPGPRARRRSRILSIVTGVVLVAVDLVARYFDVFWSALPRSVGMIGAGLLVLGIAYVLERQRKRLLERMAE